MGKHIISFDEARAADAHFIDARWFLPTQGRKPEDEYAKGHIPGAALFPLEEVTTPHPDHPHRAPSPERMAEWLGSVGITPEDPVVVYDETGFFSAPRLWFLMKALGHESVRVLDRGLEGWREAGGELTAEAPAVAPVVYPVPENLVWPVVAREAVVAAIETGEVQIADARPRGRFEGLDPEPRPGLPSGHMPGAFSVPYADLVNENGSLNSAQELDTIFSRAGLKKNDQTFVTCGSGVSACVIALGLAEAGWDTGTWLYDGSWIDWASHPKAEIVSQ